MILDNEFIEISIIDIKSKNIIDFSNEENWEMNMIIENDEWIISWDYCQYILIKLWILQRIRIYIEFDERIISSWREIWWSYDRYEDNLYTSFLLNISMNSWYSSRIKERSGSEIISLRLLIITELISMNCNILIIYNWASDWFDVIMNIIASMNIIINDLYFIFSFWILILIFSFWIFDFSIDRS